MNITYPEYSETPCSAPKYRVISLFARVNNNGGKRTVASMVTRLAGVLLLVAAALKAWQFITSPVPAAPSVLPPRLYPALISAELFLGLWLVCGLFPSLARRVAIGAFAVFAAYTAYEGFLGRNSCGCFGKVAVNPWVTLVIDTTVVLLLLFMAKPAALLQTQRKSGPAVALLIAVGVAAGAAAAVLHPKPVAIGHGLISDNHGRLVILEPGRWVGHRLPVLNDIVAQVGNMPLASTLGTGRWVVLMYHASCGECERTIPTYQRAAQKSQESGRPLRMAFVRVASNIDKSASPVRACSGKMVWGILNTSHQWFATTPVAVEMENGKVTKAAADSAAMKLNWLN